MNDAWRLLLTGPGEPAENMADDAALADAVRAGAPATLRIYSWRRPAISLGRHQPLSVLGAFRSDTPVVRRPTGGGLVRHDDDVSYALACLPAQLGGRPARALYGAFHAALGRALGAGYRLYQGPARSVPASAVCFRDPVENDLMAGETKVAGAAQRRWRDGFLQQGTVREPRLGAMAIAGAIEAAWRAALA